MNKVLVCALLLSFGAQAAGAADIGTNGTTILRIEERSIPSDRERLVPATQFFGVDAARLADGNLSLHLFGWGRYDFADISAGDDRSDGHLDYGYLQYRFTKADAEIRAGRQFVSEGVAHEQIDGIFARANLVHGFTAAVFGGMPVKVKIDNKGDYILGGRVGYGRAGVIDVGVSAVHEKGARSWEYAPIPSPATVIADGDRQLVGADLWLAAGSMAEIEAFTAYNPATSDLAEQNYLLQLAPGKEITLAAFFTERRYDGYFAGTSLPRLFRPDSLDDTTQYGGSATWKWAEPLEFVIEYRRIDRASIGDTDRVGLETRLALSTISSRFGFEYYRYFAPDVPTPASLIADYSLSFHQLRGWMLYEPARYLLSLDVIGNIYDDSDNPNLNGESSDFEATASAGYRFLEGLTVSGDVAYGKNALMKDELRAVARVEFSFGRKR